MKKNILVILFMTGCAFIDNDIIDQENKFYGTDETLDIVSWNIENFPKIDSTIELLAPIIDSLNVDIFALQEITNSEALSELSNFLGDNWIYFRSGSSNSEYGELSYLVNINTITVSQTPFSILNTYSYEFSYREPYVLEFEFEGKDYVLINIHYKSDWDGDWSERRYTANYLLYEYINEYYNEDNLFVVGDFNDLLIDNDNIFDMFLNDTLNYYFTDVPIASGSSYYWSYPTYPSHIDHILITNELFNYEDTTATLFIDQWYFDGFNDYNTFISDHRPVAIRVKY